MFGLIIIIILSIILSEKDFKKTMSSFITFKENINSNILSLLEKPENNVQPIEDKRIDIIVDEDVDEWT